MNAPNSEYAWNLLEKTGARRKLIQMDAERFKTENTLSWWMNKEPLRSKEFEGSGKTAKEVFDTEEIIVSHETNSFKAYDNITRSARGEANAFISRSGVIGETAAFGDGFYTKMGKEGARGTGLTIRFKLHPEAREGSDFIVNGDYIIIQNKKALILIQENLNLSVMEYLRVFEQGGITDKDQGLIEKFNRKFNRLENNSKDFIEAKEYIRAIYTFENIPENLKYKLTELDKEDVSFETLQKMILAKDTNYSNMLSLVSTLGFFSLRALLEEMLEKGLADNALIDFISDLPQSRIDNDWINTLLERGNVDAKIADLILKLERFKKDEELVKKLLSRNDLSTDIGIIINVLGSELYAYRLDLLEHFLSKKDSLIDSVLVEYVLSKNWWLEHPQLEKILKKIVSRQHADNGLIENILPHLQSNFKQEMITHYLSLDKKEVNARLVEHVLAKDISKLNAENLLKIKYIDGVFYALARHILPDIHMWEKYIDLQELLIPFVDSKNKLYFLVGDHLTKQHSSVGEKVIDLILEQEQVDNLNVALIERVLKNVFWSHRTDLVDKLLSNEKYLPVLIREVFSQSFWPQYDDLIESLILNNYQTDISHTAIEKVLSRVHWSHRIDLVRKIVEQNDYMKDQYLIMFVFSNEHWNLPDELIKLMIKRHYNVDLMGTLFTHKNIKKRSDLFLYLMEQGADEAVLGQIVSEVFSTEIRYEASVILKLLSLKKPEIDMNLHDFILTESVWESQPEVFSKLIENGHHDRDIEELYAESVWSSHPAILSYLDGKKFSPEAWRSQKPSFSDWLQMNQSKEPLQCQKFLE